MSWEARSTPASPLESSAPAVETTGLGRRYGRSWALVDVSLSVPRGSTVLIAGRNGSGKSTLLRVLAGALSPDMGTVRIDGHDAMNDRDGMRRRVALLSHHTNAYEALSALENLRLVARILKRPSSRADMLALLDEVGLAARADDTVQTFSAGMRKRLAFARVFLQEPSVVLLDEPYAQLDPPGARFVDSLVPRLHASGATILMAEHLLERGAELCDRGIVLDRGRIVWTGSGRDLPKNGGLMDPLPSVRAA